MRLITWNCQGAYRNKAEVILAHKPDVLIVQECENPSRLAFSSTTLFPNDYLWFGDNEHKGLGVFSYCDYKFRLIDNYNERIKFIAPISVIGGIEDFTLFAIWANNKNDADGRYVEQVWKAVNYYEKILVQKQSILIGDFNSNKIWDKTHKSNNHSAVVDRLSEIGIISVYHEFFKQEQGDEFYPTFYLQKNINKPYHIDYCFATTTIYEKVTNLDIGSFDNWLRYSDHMPLIIDIEFDNNKKKNSYRLIK